MLRVPTGLIAAVPTPFDAAGEIKLDAIARFVDALVDAGVQGVFSCGSSGEFPSLTLRERKAVSTAYRDAVNGRMTFIVHVGHTCLRDARELAAHARDIGADAIAALAPFYFKPTDAETVAAGLAEISAAAPETPIYYYHIPARTHVHFPMIDLLRLAETRLPQLAGVKFTFEDLMELRDCVAFADGRYNMLFGRDEMLLAGLATGATGAVGTTYSIMPGPYLRIIDAVEAGDLETARREQLHAVRLIRLMQQYGGLPTTKTILKLQGHDFGTTRLPLVPLTAEQDADLRTELRKIQPLAPYVSGT